WTIEPEHGDADRQRYLAFWRDRAADPVTYEEAYSAAAGERKYTVYTGGQKFAAFTLAAGGQKSRYGFDQWAFQSAQCLLLPQITAYSVRVNDGAQVYLDGVPLGEDALVDSPVEEERSWLSKDKTIARQYRVYQWTVFEGEQAPSVRVQLADGADCPVEQVGDAEYAAIRLYDEAARAEHADRAVFLAQRYALFMSGNLSKTGFLKYCATGTAFARLIKDYDDRWFKASVARKFTDVSADCFLPLGKSAYSCEVSFNFTEKARDGTVRTSPTAYKLYVVKTGGQWKLYNVEIQAAKSQEDVQ
ncbi:MAG: hypothetical protein GX558_04245, partial [Clostridiales bacterium]|nr:hypothetical protein [Clostridiales bacterium]